MLARRSPRPFETDRVIALPAGDALLTCGNGLRGLLVRQQDQQQPTHRSTSSGAHFCQACKALNKALRMRYCVRRRPRLDCGTCVCCQASCPTKENQLKSISQDGVVLDWRAFTRHAVQAVRQERRFVWRWAVYRLRRPRAGISSTCLCPTIMNGLATATCVT